MFSARARNEAADFCAVIVILIRPHDGRAEAIGLGHDFCVRYDNPFSMEPHAIVAILGVPVDSLYTDAICERTAQAISAGELIEPRLERRISVAGRQGRAAMPRSR